MKELNCPKGHGPMGFEELEKQTTFKDVDITYTAEALVCSECELGAGTVKTADDVQRAISDAYRSKVGFLTSNEIMINGRRLIT